MSQAVASRAITARPTEQRRAVVAAAMLGVIQGLTAGFASRYGTSVHASGPMVVRHRLLRYGTSEDPEH